MRNFGFIFFGVLFLSTLVGAKTDDPFHQPPPQSTLLAPQEQVKPLTRPNYEVIGVVTTPQRQVAAIVDSAGKIHLVMKGDKLPDGSIVRQIGLEKVIVRHAQYKIVLDVPR